MVEQSVSGHLFACTSRYGVLNQILEHCSICNPLHETPSHNTTTSDVIDGITIPDTNFLSNLLVKTDSK